MCGAAPGLVTGGDGLSYHVADGLEALELGRHRLHPRLPGPGPRRAAGRRRRRRCIAAHERGRPARRDLDRRVRARRDRPARRQARHHALALHAGARGEASARPGRRERAVRRRGRACSPRPAPPPASTCACTSCARDHGVGRVQPRRPGGWSRRRTAAAARRSTCRAACPSRSASVFAAHPRVGAAPARRAAHPRGARPARARCRRARSRGGSSRTPATRRCSGCCGPASTWPANCSSAPSSASSRSPTDVGLGTGANLRLHFQRILGTSPTRVPAHVRGLSASAWREPWPCRRVARSLRTLSFAPLSAPSPRASMDGGTKGTTP